MYNRQIHQKLSAISGSTFLRQKLLFLKLLGLPNLETCLGRIYLLFLDCFMLHNLVPLFRLVFLQCQSLFVQFNGCVERPFLHYVT